MRGLYIHIPFCKTRCHYCNFVTVAGSSSDLRERFLEALEKEISHAREKYGPLSFDTLYLGGGTPSGLSAVELERLAGSAQKDFAFSAGYEFTCEFNPGDGDEGRLKALHSMGVNRVSLGCQSFRDEILQRLGRRHTVQDITETLAKIRQAGISNISFDLMLRLPGQTVRDFRDSVERCVELGASQVSLYDLEVHAGTPFGKDQTEGKLDLPGEEDHARMYESAIEILTQAGYEHYEISNFARPGFASRHNLIYWHNQEYLGLGPGAFSYLKSIRSQYASDLGRYIEKCEAGDWKNGTEDKLSEEEQETETFAMGLRLREGVAPEGFSKIYPQLKNCVHSLVEDGLLEIRGKNLRLTNRGQFLSEDVFSFLLNKTGK